MLIRGGRSDILPIIVIIIIIAIIVIEYWTCQVSRTMREFHSPYDQNINLMHREFL